MTAAAADNQRDLKATGGWTGNGSSGLPYEVLDFVSRGAFVWGPDDRLVHVTPRAKESVPAIAERLVPGIHVTELLEFGADEQIGQFGVEDRESWLNEMLRRHRALEDGPRIRHPDGTEMLVKQYRLPDGGTLGVWHDVTEIAAANSRATSAEEALDKLTVGATIYDAKQRLVLANQTVHKAFGTDSNLLKPGTPRSAIIRKFVDLGLVDKDLLQAVEEYGRSTREMAGKGGRRFRVSSYPLSDGGRLVLREDVTEQLDAEEKLADSQAAITSLLNAIRDRAGLFDRECRILAVNNAFAEGLDMTADALVGTWLADHVPGILEARRRRVIEEVFNSRSPVEFEEQTNGRWNLHSVYPVFGADGDVVAAAVLIRDVTKERNFTQELENAKLQAEIADRGKTDFLANMSHELRTPLNAVIGFSDGLLSEHFGAVANERQREYLSAIRDSGSHLLMLINDILDVSAIEAGHMNLRESTFSSSELIESVLTMVRPRAEVEGVHLIDDSTQCHAILKADVTRLKQVLSNLFANAIKFTPAGGAVTVSAELTQARGIHIAVTDTGVGMTASEIETAMTRFGKVASDPMRESEGTGLGLPLSAGLIEAHGGVLRIESAPDTGTTAHIFLPPARVIS